MNNSFNKEFGQEENISGSQLNNMLSKYSVIWIWSIIIGLNSGLTYTFYNARINNYGSLNYILIAFNLLPIIASVMTWFSLYRVLTFVILPSIFPTNSKIEYKPDSKYHREVNPFDVSDKENKDFDSEIKEQEYLKQLHKTEDEALQLEEYRVTAKRLISGSMNLVIMALAFRFVAYMIENVFTALSKL